MEHTSPAVLTLPDPSPHGDLYVIGDVHGECAALVDLIDRLPLGCEDVVIQIGDCVGRGPQSFEVVEYLIRFGRCRRYVVRGNHDALFYRYLQEGHLGMMASGGDATVQSYRRNGWSCTPGDPGSVPPSHLRFNGRGYPWTVSLIRTPEYVFTHAGYDMSRSPEEQSEVLLGSGKVIGQSESRTQQTVVRGHLPFPEVTFTAEGWIGVDTGCGKGGLLSCLRLPDRAVFTSLSGESSGK